MVSRRPDFWKMASPKKIDDPFGSDDEGFDLMHKEWSSVEERMRNAGVRDAMESSQDNVIQEGFNTAFSDALRMAIAAGQLQGGISALLSCPFQDATQGVGKERASLPKLQQETQLQHLLSSNSSLMAGIPGLLQPEVLKTVASYPGKTGTVGKSNGIAGDRNVSTEFDQSMASCTTAIGSTGAKEGLSPEQRSVISCEAVCSNREHFWTQLESFKIQAQTLGVVYSKE